jgi:tetratricopeptide (TPR) repeat protein
MEALIMLAAEWNDLDEAFFKDDAFHAFQAAFDSKDYASSMDLLSTLISKYPAHPCPHLYKADVFEALRQYQDARPCFARVVEMCLAHIKDLEEEDANHEPTWDTVVETVAGFLFSRRSHLRMMDHALFRTAVTFDKENQRTRCLEELEKAFKRRACSVHLGNRLALLYLELGREKDAKHACKDCLTTELYDADADDWMTLSELLSNLNMPEESVIAQGKADQLARECGAEPGDPGVS